MIKNYLKIFFRNTLKNPFYSFINIMGLSVGLACSIVAFLYILNEASYNKRFKDYDKIYRIGAGMQSELFNDSGAATLPEIVPALLEQVPEVVAATGFVTWYMNSLIKFDNEFYPGVKGLISDSMMLNVFSFKILQGDPGSFLKSPNQIAISQSFAKRIFKNKDPMHQLIKFENQDLEVAWILEDPKNSIVNYDIIASIDFIGSFKESLRLDVYTFFKTSVPLNNALEAKIRRVSDKIILEAFSDWTKIVNSPIQALDDLYLRSNLTWEVGRTGSLRTLYIFGFLAGIILLIAIINYINLLTSRSESRNKEVGIRKVSGADKSRLKIQFLGESVILTLIALLISFVLSEFFIYVVNSRLNIQLSLFGQANFSFFIVWILGATLVGILSGIYPAFVMSQYSPLKVIKGIFESNGNTNLLKIVLVIIQFSISTLLIITILIFNSQIKYLKSKNLGFDEKNLIVLPECTEKLNKNLESIKQDLLSYHHVKMVSASQSIPGWGRSGQGIRKKSNESQKVIAIAENRVQEGYIETMGIELIKGRTFNPLFDDNRSIIINETAAKLLDVDDPIGLEVETNRESVIIGVVKDYHFYATTQELGSLYLSNYSTWFNTIVIRINPEDKLGTVKFIKDLIMKYDPDYYWNYFFIDDMFANEYKVEDRLFSMIFWASGIAVILSVLGLFALTSYTVSKRFKEIGIRKTFGATVDHIIYKLNRDIIKWVLFTNLIAWPVAYYIMNNWLQNYPYHVNISWVYFVLASLISLSIALITISFQAFKAARMNPVDAIRYQ